LAPPGTKVIIHEPPSQRKSWAPHGIDGWYIGPATEHYRCYRAYVTKTKSERIANTVTFEPHLFSTPYLSPSKQAIQAAQSLTEALKNTVNTPPFQTPQTETMKALTLLANIFQHSIKTDTTRPTKTTSPPRVPAASFCHEHIPSRNNLPQPVQPSRVVTNQQTPPPSATVLPPVPAPTLLEHQQPTYTQHRYPTRYQNRMEHQRHVVASNSSLIHVACPIIHNKTGAAIEYRHLIKDNTLRDVWINSFANELGRGRIVVDFRP